jgi:hypothetical protein
MKEEGNYFYSQIDYTPLNIDIAQMWENICSMCVTTYSIQEENEYQITAINVVHQRVSPS